MMTPKDQRPKAPSRPDLTGIVTPDQPERRAVRHPGVDGVDQPPPRRGTLTGMPAPAAMGSRPPPLPPRLPTELAPTIKAPARPTLKQTWRLPTPPSALARARRTDPPVGDESSASADAPESTPGASAELVAAHARIAQLERDARAAADTRIVSYPPPVQRTQTPVPNSTAPKASDWEKLRFKVATAIVAALVIVIAALSYWAVAAIDAKTAAIKEAQEAKSKADSRDAQWRQWASVVTWIQDCRNGQQLDVNEMLLPAPDKMGSARKPEPWIVKCPKLLPPPP